MTGETPSPRPVFIVGSGRSGTTLLATLLNRFPRVHIAKETGYISRGIALLEEADSSSAITGLVALTNSWLAVEGWQNRAEYDAFRRFARQSGLPGAAAYVNYVWQLDSRRDWKTLDIIGDNTPAYVWAIPKLERLLPGALYIHIVRDPRDVVASMKAMRFGANDALTAAVEWLAHIGAWMAAERIVPPGRRMELRYEDLCRDPSAALSRVARFLGQEPEVSRLALSPDPERDREFRSVALKPHHAALADQLTSARIGSYKASLNSREIAAVESVTQHLLPVLGYEFDTWRLSPLMEDRRLSLTGAYMRDAMRKLIRRVIR